MNIRLILPVLLFPYFLTAEPYLMNMHDVTKGRPALLYTLEEAQKMFCRNPFEAVCHSGGASQERVNEEIEADTYKNRIQGALAKDLIKKFQISSGAESALYTINIPPPPSVNHVNDPAVEKSPMPNGYFAPYLEAAYDDVHQRARIPDRFFTDLSGGLGKVVENFKDLPKQAAMLKALNDTLFIYSSETLREAVEKKGDEVLEEIRAACQEDGMASAAYFFPGLKVFVLCPGLIAASVKDKTEDKNANKSTPNFKGAFLAAVVHHEKAHSVHPGGCSAGRPRTAFYRSYDPFIQCMFKNFGHPTMEDSELTLQAFKSYSCEIVADELTSYAVVPLLAQEKDPFERFKRLREMLSPLCFYSGDELHPSGKYRIESIFAKNPELRRTMGCDPVLACTPTGTFDPKKKPS